MVDVPSQYVEPLKFMSLNTGIPYGVCACQANEESGFQQYARSPAGALGWLQFLPSTFAEYGGGDIFGIWNQANAYVNYMNHLLRVFHGSVRYALAGYNAGEGNPGAGLGYADTILSCAGQPVKTITQKSSTPSNLAPPAPVSISSDDWSGTMRNAADKLFALGSRFANYGEGIKRM